MSKYSVTYYRQYEVKDNDKNDALGIADQDFANDIRKTLFEQGGSRITDLFKFKVEKIK